MSPTVAGPVDDPDKDCASEKPVRPNELRLHTGELTAALEDLTAAIDLSAAGPPVPVVEKSGEHQRCVA